ncbi:Het-C-domain-containing protein [Acephala macrosclerotiorum]|nr:Het-C-domain-containing protein [Acephala macrosclerotiorum]
MLSFSTSTAVLTLAILLLLARPAHAFGAGNIASISKIEGLNWRHGDIEDTLLTIMMSRAAGGKKFDKMNVARVYFGNWLRDYSQAIDVGTVKYVSAEAIRILLWVLGFMTFGYGTKEFEVTAERLGCYRPEDHIDNPKDYADNLDATQYDPRLRGPVNERVELAIDPRTGLKNYIANEQAGIMTSALHVRKLFGKCIQLGRSYAHSRNKDELYESLRLLGTGLHCLEDYSAHSNYTELALIEMGERDIFPHVGRNTSIRLQGAQHPVYPIVTGTFGGVDFLHSVMGEFDDKATQSEIQELEGSLQNNNSADTSMLKQLLSSIPSGIFKGKDEAGKADELQANATAAQMNQMRVSPRQPEEFTRQMQQTVKEIYPIIQWHDEIMQSITETIEKIPILPDLIENLENQVNIFVFSLLAPFVVPIIDQIKTELNEGSSEIIQSSKDKQLIVFNDPNSSDPTHSMLSKDHFSNVLNEPAGKIASQVLKWAVPQLMLAIDDQNVDPDRTINRIINGVFHHPAQRQMGDDGAAEGRRLMFGVVEQWWRGKSQYEQDSLRRQLSREGVQNGENHKEGVHDTGHGCGKPLGMAKSAGGAGNTAAGALMGGLSSALSGGSSSGGGFGGQSGGYGGASSPGISKFAEEAVGGGALGSIVGGLAGVVGGGLLSGAFGGPEKPETKTYGSQGYTQGGGYQQNYTEVGHSGDQYAQAQVSQTQYPGGGRQTDYQRYEQSNTGGGGYGFEERVQTQPIYGGGYEQTTERITQRPGYEAETETWRQHKKSDDEDSDDSYKKREKKKHHKKHHSGSGGEGYGGRVEESEARREDFGGRGGGYGGGGYGERERFEERREEPRRQEYGRRDEYGGRGGFGGGFQERPPPPREEFGGRGGYGGGGFEERGERFEEPPRQEYGGGRGGFGGGDEYGGGRGGFGGGYQEPPRQEYGGGNEAGWGERREEEQQEEYREERREEEYGERREGGGGWFS